MDIKLASGTRSLDIFREEIQGSSFQELFDKLLLQMDPWKAMEQVQKTMLTSMEYPEKDVPSDNALSDMMGPILRSFGPKKECQCVRCRLGEGEEISDKEIADHFRLAVAKYNDYKKKYSETKQDLYIQLAEASMGFFISDFEER